MGVRKKDGLDSRHEMSADEEQESVLEQLADQYREANQRFRTTIDLNATVNEEATDPQNAELRRDLRLAMERVGTSAEDRARWLVRFATQDLAKLSAGDLWNLQWDVLAFAAAPGSTRIAFEFYTQDGQVAVDVAYLHTWLSRLKGLAGQVRITMMHPDSREEEQPPIWNIETKMMYTFGLVDGRLVDMSSANAGSTLDRFKAHVYNVLASQAARLRFCQNCGQLFVARKRQEYCTGKCSQAVRTRKYRTQNPEKFRRLRHEAYERRHPSAKVVRRRRVSPRRSRTEPFREEPGDE
jgi:hypothetical protein